MTGLADYTTATDVQKAVDLAWFGPKMRDVFNSWQQGKERNLLYIAKQCERQKRTKFNDTMT